MQLWPSETISSISSRVHSVEYRVSRSAFFILSPQRQNQRFHLSSKRTYKPSRECAKHCSIRRVRWLDNVVEHEKDHKKFIECHYFRFNDIRVRVCSPLFLFSCSSKTNISCMCVQVFVRTLVCTAWYNCTGYSSHNHRLITHSFEVDEHVVLPRDTL